VIGGVPILSSRDLTIKKQPAPYTLDSAIGLRQVQLATDERNGLTLTFIWQSLRPVTYDAIMFVHLERNDGSLITQTDRQPLNGRFPTSYWQPGQIATDVIHLPPNTVPLGELTTLSLGMYTWPSMQRLSVRNASGSPEPDDIITMNIPSLSSSKQVSLP
jgi:hypothetical protein